MSNEIYCPRCDEGHFPLVGKSRNERFLLTKEPVEKGDVLACLQCGQLWGVRIIKPPPDYKEIQVLSELKQCFHESELEELKKHKREIKNLPGHYYPDV